MEVFEPAQKQSIPACRTVDDICPQCKSWRYLSQHMKLLVSPCYHKMCDDCVANRFSAGPAPCPHTNCGRILRKGDFYQAIFEDLTVENEVRIRQQISMIYNKREEDFKSLADYNTYLEMVEDMIMKLLYEMDADEVDDMIKAYKRENQASIKKNQTKQQREDKLQQMRSMQERLKRQQQRDEHLKEVEEERRLKEQVKNSLIDELASSDKDAKDIVKKKMVQLKKSSLSQRGALRKAQVDIGSLLGTLDDGFDDDDDDDMDEEEPDLGPFYPNVTPYEPMNVELRDKYDDPNPAFRQASLLAGGVTREMHQRYMIEGAMSGLFAPPATDSPSG
ncbi:TFIIH/NER complex subunit [Coemansia sp. RSA 552]|nr:TFIIH/NER complex subunit [Coemansia sp. RSA 552]